MGIRKLSFIFVTALTLLVTVFDGAPPALVTSAAGRPQAQTPTAKPIEVVGWFGNVKHVGDDALGYSLRLWKQGDQVFRGVNVGSFTRAFLTVATRRQIT